MTDTVVPPAELRIARDGEGSTLVVTGELTLATTRPLWERLAGDIEEAGAGPVVLDVSGVPDCDTAGAALLFALTEDLKARGVEVTLRGANDRVQALVRLTSRPAVIEYEPRASRDIGIIRESGRFAARVIENTHESVEYIGLIALALFQAVVKPSSVRWKDVRHYMSRAGADAFGIVALINGLLGMILALQSVAQLGKYGLENLTPQAVAASMVNELGPLMTAIIVAGRSGSGFAAEIGTMKVREEVSALRTMGLDQTRFLVLPKVLALLLVMPFLAVFANLCGLGGGMLISLAALDSSIAGYLQESVGVLHLHELVEGLVKAEFYALAIAAVGCLRGLQTAKGAQGVGVSATSAVVTSIFLIICIDAVLTAVYQTLHAL